MTTFFTSDLHLGHVRCATEFRGFDSVDAHNRTIVDRWNDTVQDGDVVYVVGDICMGKMDDSLALAATLRGHKCLVPGNHDRMHPAYHQKGDPAAQRAKRDAWRERYFDDAGFVTMARAVMFEAPTGGEFTVCHFPYSDDHVEYADEPRYPEYRPEDTGTSRLVHGHIHDLRRESVDGRQVNVGVDMWDFAPVSFERLMETMRW
jgi:calcineurin-like phosphoesterase family protein